MPPLRPEYNHSFKILFTDFPALGWLGLGPCLGKLEPRNRICHGGSKSSSERIGKIYKEEVSQSLVSWSCSSWHAGKFFCSSADCYVSSYSPTKPEREGSSKEYTENSLKENISHETAQFVLGRGPFSFEKFPKGPCPLWFDGLLLSSWLFSKGSSSSSWNLGWGGGGGNRPKRERGSL